MPLYSSLGNRMKLHLKKVKSSGKGELQLTFVCIVAATWAKLLSAWEDDSPGHHWLPSNGQRSLLVWTFDWNKLLEISLWLYLKSELRKGWLKGLASKNILKELILVWWGWAGEGGRVRFSTVFPTLFKFSQLATVTQACNHQHFRRPKENCLSPGGWVCTAVSPDSATALHHGQQSKTLSQKTKKILFLLWKPNVRN